MADGDISLVQDAFEATESHEGLWIRRHNQLDLVALYARRIELTAPKKAAHPSLSQKGTQHNVDEWALVELVQFGRPMVEDNSEPTVEDLPMLEPIVETHSAPVSFRSMLRRFFELPAHLRGIAHSVSSAYLVLGALERQTHLPQRPRSEELELPETTPSHLA
jgi:hypothetical protein